jgi:phosphate transport system protein
MPRDEFRADLHDLRAGVVEMGDLVLGRLDDALAALETGDGALAREVVDGDAEINERYLELEGDCVDLLALQQPVASDLRFVTASFKVITDLERVGDLATNLASYALAADEDPTTPVDLAAIGADARDMLADALDAYEAGDPEACHDIAARDDQLDAACQATGQQVVRDLIERRADDSSWAVEAALDDVSRVLLTVRDIERVGDHAVNVAARTLYAAESDPDLIY